MATRKSAFVQFIAGVVGLELTPAAAWSIKLIGARALVVAPEILGPTSVDGPAVFVCAASANANRSIEINMSVLMLVKCAG